MVDEDSFAWAGNGWLSRIHSSRAHQCPSEHVRERGGGSYSGFAQSRFHARGPPLRRQYQVTSTLGMKRKLATAIEHAQIDSGLVMSRNPNWLVWFFEIFEVAVAEIDLECLDGGF